MHYLRRERLAACFVILLAVVSGPGQAAEECPQGEEAVTASDPAIPVDELELRLKPRTRCELKAEADAWQKLLQGKVLEISEAEIAVKYKNEEIKTTSKAVQAIEEAREAQKEAGDEAAETVEKARDAAEEAREAAKKTQQDRLARDALETAMARQDEAQEPAGADDAPKESKSAEEAVLEEKTGQKAALLDLLTELRAQRTALIDRVNAVLAEYELKGGDPADYRQYVKAVSGIKVDVSDASTTWATVTGWLTSPEGGLRWAGNFAQFVIIVIGFYLLSVILSKAAKRALNRARQLSTLLRAFIETTIRRLVLFVGLFVGLAALEVNVGPVLAIIGAAGFVIAFALQNSLSNFASGILMLLYRPFDVGDAVDVAGTQGTVQSMNLLSTHIKTFDNRSVIVPNNSVWGDVITNITGTDMRRVDMVFGIGYQDDIDRAQRVLEEILAGDDRVLKEPPSVVRLHELGDSSVNFICRPWVKPGDYWSVYWDVTRAVKQRFDSEGISIPFPQRDVHLYHAGGEEKTAD